jgi:hypothetical protein
MLVEVVEVGIERVIMVGLAALVAALEVEITEKMGPPRLVPLILAAGEEVVVVRNIRLQVMEAPVDRVLL